MPPKGYDRVEEDPRLMEQSYYQEYEDSVKMTREIKNFIEGYYDSSKNFKTKMYQLRNDPEFYETAKKAYQTMYIK